MAKVHAHVIDVTITKVLAAVLTIQKWLQLHLDANIECVQVECIVA